MQRTLAVVGSLNREAPYFGGAHGKGMAVFDFDEASGKLTLLAERTGIDNPSFLTIDAGRRCVYATSEVYGWNEGIVTAFRLDPASGTLRYINKQPTLGSIAAHCGLDHSGRHLLVVNYSMDNPADPPGQSVAVFAVRDDGGLAAAACSVRHTGAGPVAARQEGPHPHCALPSPDNRFVLVSDLGIDRVLAYRFDAATGQLDPAPAASLALPRGSGPRHLAFHPGGKYLYVINELANTITTLAYAPATGGLTALQSVPALPGDFAGESHCADLHIDPAGRFLYGCNRGHDSIVVHAADPASGLLTLVGHFSCGGHTPRNFALDPSGRFLLVANQDSDRVVVFHVDPQTGALAASGEIADVGTPMCVRLARFTVDAGQ